MVKTKRTTKRGQDPKVLNFEEICKLSGDEFGDALFAKLTSEKKPVLSHAAIDVIETFVANSVRPRRAALAYLSQPWAKIEANIRRDRDFAVTSAVVASCLDETIDGYRNLVSLMESSRSRILVALCSREDMKEVTIQGEREAHHA